MSRRAQLIVLPFLLVPLILLLIVGALVFTRRGTAAAPATGGGNTAGGTTSGEAQTIDDSKPAPTIPPGLSEAFDAEDALLTALYRERSPAVVAIRILGAPVSGFELPLPDEDQTPGPDDEDGQGDEEGPEFGFQAEGSGFLIDDEGHLVTNNHVVEGAQNIEVTFTDGSTVEAEVVGADEDSDLAVIKVDRVPAGVSPLSLADSKELMVGQRAIAIGNPFGYDSTLTVGVISARGRTLPNRRVGPTGGSYSLADLIQTDAAINPGNSGGPLFNSDGEVIGVNTAISSQSGSFEGVGFAVPSNMVRRVATALISTGTYEHPYLGVSMAGLPITDAVAEELNLPVTRGVPISGVEEGGPADQAGIIAGDEEDAVIIRGGQYPVGSDIVLAIDDRQVADSSDVIDYLATETEVGQTVTLTVLRDGQEIEVPVVLGARPRR